MLSNDIFVHRKTRLKLLQLNDYFNRFLLIIPSFILRDYNCIFLYQ